MKTYVMEVDGRPTVAFRAENEFRRPSGSMLSRDG